MNFQMKHKKDRGWFGESERHREARLKGLGRRRAELLRKSRRPPKQYVIPDKRDIMVLETSSKKKYPTHRLKKDRIPEQPDNIRVMLKKTRKIPKITIKSPRDVVDMLQDMEHNDREYFKLVSLDTKNRVVGIETVSIGSLNATIIHPREVFKGAVLSNANSVLCIHNHPSGVPEFSDADEEGYRKLKDAGEIMKIRLLDFLVIGAKGSYKCMSG